MQLIIDEIEYQGEFPTVTGKTAVGTVKGIWKYIKAPVVGKNYRVELDVAYPEEVCASEKGQLFPSVYLDNGKVIFTCVCEDSDSEVYYLRFDNDWIEMLDIDIITSGKKKGDYIIFSADYNNIGIYPYELQR